MADCSPDDVGRWRQYHQITATELKRLAVLIERLRLLSRLESPDAPLVREPVNMKAVVEDVIMNLYEVAEEQMVRLRYVGPQRPARVMGDRDALRQVLLNLVGNGVKYSKEQGGEVVINVQEEQDRLCVRISDEGIGIAEEDLARIFDPFYRVPDAGSFRSPGTGLGLMLVRRIVEQHGGDVWVRSQLGEGSTFSFELPLYVPA
jgi:two-component system phosphate regulon sensor histidine kinase PhoR